MGGSAESIQRGPAFIGKAPQGLGTEYPALLGIGAEVVVEPAFYIVGVLSDVLELKVACILFLHPIGYFLTPAERQCQNHKREYI